MSATNNKPTNNDTPHIIILSEYYPPHWTGVAKSIHYAAQNLLERGAKVTVMTTQFTDETPVQGHIDGVSVIRVPYQFKISRTHYSFAIIWRFFRMLWKSVPSKNTANNDTVIDEVVINSPNSNILFFALLAKLFGKKLTVYHQADILLPRQTGNVVFHWLIERVFDIFTIPAMLMANIVSSFTRDYAEFSRVMRYSVYKFQPYIPPVKLSSEKPRTSFKKHLDALANKHHLIGISGRFVEEKGFDILFKALPIKLDKGSKKSTHVVFAGKKKIDYEPFYDRHKELFEKNDNQVTFLGFLQEGDLAYFYEKLDVFVLSSRIECFALTQIEAARKGVPIVVTDVPGARQLVKKSGFGVVVNREDTHALHTGIIDVLTHREKYAKNRSKALKYIDGHDFPSSVLS